MKWIRRLLLAFGSLILLVVVFAVIVIQIERYQTNYLKIDDDSAWNENSFVIKNVNIVPMYADTILSNKDVLIQDGVIRQIGDSLLADGITIINANGAYLSPGLIDMHVHVWDRFELGLYLANGVTTVRSLLGMPFHLDVKKELKSGKIIGPDFFTSSPQFSGPDDGDIFHKQMSTPEEAAELVKEYKGAGYDYIKTYNLLPKPLFDAVLEQAVQSEIPVIAHPSFLVDYDYHFDERISTVEHTEDIYQQALNYSFNREKLRGVVEGYAKSGQTHCPTLTVFYNLTQIYNKGEEVLSSEQTPYLNTFVESVSGDFKRHMAIRSSDSSSIQRVNQQHQFHLEMVSQLYQAGVNIVAGTDAGIVNTAAGFSIHQELEFYTQAGMTNYDALKTATVNPVNVCEEMSLTGTVEEGKLANLILSKGNPLDDLAVLKSPEWVMIHGRLVDKEQMELLKQKAAQRKNFLATVVRAITYVLWGK